MSRWISAAEESQFRTAWSDILELKDTLVVDDQSIAADVSELARLIKVIKYLDELLQACDPELMPISIWHNVNNQTHLCREKMRYFSDTRQTIHLAHANDHIDNLLSYIRPYIISSGKAARSASASFTAYNKAINKQLLSFQNEIEEVSNTIEEYRSHAERDSDQVHQSMSNIVLFEKELFHGSEQDDSLDEKINCLYKKTMDHADQIESMKVKLIDGDAEDESIFRQVSNSAQHIYDTENDIGVMLKESKSQIEDLNDFYDEIYGTDK